MDELLAAWTSWCSASGVQPVKGRKGEVAQDLLLAASACVCAAQIQGLSRHESCLPICRQFTGAHFRGRTNLSSPQLWAEVPRLLCHDLTGQTSLLPRPSIFILLLPITHQLSTFCECQLHTGLFPFPTLNSVCPAFHIRKLRSREIY